MKRVKPAKVAKRMRTSPQRPARTNSKTKTTMKPTLIPMLTLNRTTLLMMKRVKPAKVAKRIRTSPPRPARTNSKKRNPTMKSTLIPMLMLIRLRRLLVKIPFPKPFWMGRARSFLRLRPATVRMMARMRMVVSHTISTFGKCMQIISFFIHFR